MSDVFIGTLLQSQVDDFLQNNVATDKSIAAGNTAKNTAQSHYQEP